MIINHAVKEILSGDLSDGTMQQAFNDLGIEAKRTYRRTNIKNKYDEIYEVWELSNADFEKICNIPDDEWKDTWGWWRSAEGTNLEGSPVSKMIINGEPIIAWINIHSIEYFIDEPLTDEQLYDILYVLPVENDNIVKFPEILEFDNLLEYYLRMHGCGAERNVCAISVGLAKLNNMTMGELFNKYVG